VKEHERLVKISKISLILTKAHETTKLVGGLLSGTTRLVNTVNYQSIIIIYL